MTYQNFYKQDIRTPTKYFESKDETGKALEKLKGKLNDLLTKLYALKDEGKGTPATKKIVDDEIDRAEIQRYKQVSKENALKVVEALICGTPDDATDAICEALDYKAFCRAEPYLLCAGERIEEQVFKN